MKNCEEGLKRELDYRNYLGGSSSTRKTPYTNRQIDIFKENEMYMGQLKTGKISLTAQIKLDLIKDAYFVDKGYFVEYFLENGATKPVLETMKHYGITYKLGKLIN